MTNEFNEPAVENPTIDPNNVNKTGVFTARLELRSVGLSANIVPHVSWSHQFTASPTEDQVPAAYAAMSQIVAAIDSMMTSVTPEVEAGLSDDPDEAAQQLSAMADKMDNPDRKDN